MSCALCWWGTLNNGEKKQREKINRKKFILLFWRQKQFVTHYKYRENHLVECHCFSFLSFFLIFFFSLSWNGRTSLYLRKRQCFVKQFFIVIAHFNHTKRNTPSPCRVFWRENLFRIFRCYSLKGKSTFSVRATFLIIQPHVHCACASNCPQFLIYMNILLTAFSYGTVHLNLFCNVFN